MNIYESLYLWMPVVNWSLCQQVNDDFSHWNNKILLYINNTIGWFLSFIWFVSLSFCFLILSQSYIQKVFILPTIYMHVHIVPKLMNYNFSHTSARLCFILPFWSGSFDSNKSVEKSFKIDIINLKHQLQFLRCNTKNFLFN